jgi:hypothetical protein
VVYTILDSPPGRRLKFVEFLRGEVKCGDDIGTKEGIDPQLGLKFGEGRDGAEGGTDEADVADGGIGGGKYGADVEGFGGGVLGSERGLVEEREGLGVAGGEDDYVRLDLVVTETVVFGTVVVLEVDDAVAVYVRWPGGEVDVAAVGGRNGNLEEGGANALDER